MREFYLQEITRFLSHAVHQRDPLVPRPRLHADWYDVARWTLKKQCYGTGFITLQDKAWLIDVYSHHCTSGVRVYLSEACGRADDLCRSFPPNRPCEAGHPLKVRIVSSPQGGSRPVTVASLCRFLRG